MTAALSKRSQNKKKALDHGHIKHRSVYSMGRVCPGSEKITLNKQREELGPKLLIVSFSSAKVTKHNEGGRVLPLLHYIEMLHFRRFFLGYTHPTLFTLNNHYDIFNIDEKLTINKLGP